MKMRLILTFFIAGVFMGAAMGQSARPFLEIGKRGRNYNSPIVPISLDNSTSGTLFFRTDSTMKWTPVGASAYRLKPLFMADPQLKKDFRRFQDVRAGAGACVIGATLSYVVLSASLVGLTLSRLAENPVGVEPKRSNAGYIALGSVVSCIGFTIGSLHLRKKARLRLVDLIHQYNDPTLSAVPVIGNSWSLSLGICQTGNGVGMGLRWRPD